MYLVWLQAYNVQELKGVHWLGFVTYRFGSSFTSPQTLIMVPSLIASGRGTQKGTSCGQKASLHFLFHRFRCQLSLKLTLASEVFTQAYDYAGLLPARCRSVRSIRKCIFTLQAQWDFCRSFFSESGHKHYNVMLDATKVLWSARTPFVTKPFSRIMLVVMIEFTISVMAKTYHSDYMLHLNPETNAKHSGFGV